MEKFDRFIAKLVIFGSPVIALIAIYLSFTPKGDIGVFRPSSSPWIAAIYSIWSIALFYVAIKLTTSEHTRNEIIPELIGIDGRDEREITIINEAAKKTVFSTIALIALLVAASGFYININRVAVGENTSEPTGRLELGMDVHVLSVKEQSNDAGYSEKIFNYNGLPTNTFGTLLLVLAWVIFSLRIFANLGNVRSKNNMAL